MGGEDLQSEQAGIAAAADRDGGDGDAAGHLNDGEKRVEALEGFALDGNADHGERSGAGEHAGQMRGAAGCGDDDFEAAGVGGAAEFEHIIGCAMGRENLDMRVDAEFGAGFGGRF